jgi:hypothetical protein
LYQISPSRILLAILLLVSVLPFFIRPASADTTSSYYWVTVNPAVLGPGFVLHSPVGQNVNISFQALWTYGNNSGSTIQNATIPIEVRTTTNAVIETLMPNTTGTGFVSFNYSSPISNILTFTPTKLVTEDGMEWNSSLRGDAYGFQSKPITVYWDSFDISLVSIDTSTQGVIRVSVNITYSMIPQGGLTALQPPDYSRYDYIAKYVHGADVEVNGVKAEESSVQGVYTAQTSTWLPTTYILVAVSQKGWSQTPKAFSFTHIAIETIWVPATILGFIFVVFLTIFHFVSSKEAKIHALAEKARLLTVGAILLVIASFVSIYWALVGAESVLHGFGWMALAAFGMIASAVGLAGSLRAKMRKNFTFILFAACFLMIENAALVKYSFDNYQLATPWIALAPAFIISTLGGILIGMSDEQFP